MKAIVISTPGPPAVLKYVHRSIPTPNPGDILIRIRAFGLNRSEMFTRQGHSPVKFPRILGIEAVGTVALAPGLEEQFPQGSIVATAMGGMGRAFDGGYAEYTCVPAKQAQVLQPTSLPWEVLGAVPEMLQTAWGSLMWALQVKAGDRLLIRGGTSSVGLAAAAIAKRHGAVVGATTRKKEREGLLREYGADEVWIDDMGIAEQIGTASSSSSEEKHFDKVLELVGTVTLEDSLRCTRKGGIVCMAGIVGNEWTLKEFNPMALIPPETKLTVYAGGDEQFMNTPLDDLIQQVESGDLKLRIGRVFKMDEIVEAHQCMEDSEALGKLVVVT